MLAATIMAPASALAAGEQIKTSGLPLPRYVSLKSARVNMRVGPGRDYMVDWMYMKRGLPVEVIQEYDTWRKVRDSEGNEGWVLHSLLSGDRTAIVAPWDDSGELIELRARPDSNSRIVAKLERGVVAPVQACEDGWCELEISGVHGYVAQKQVWGVYPNESFKK
jgi:SH3-like domain-containing protein